MCCVHAARLHNAIATLQTICSTETCSSGEIAAGIPSALATLPKA